MKGEIELTRREGIKEEAKEEVEGNQQHIHTHKKRRRSGGSREREREREKCRVREILWVEK